jgi:predicted nuclease of restriction endonuclease-like (RecB) superfamily
MVKARSGVGSKIIDRLSADLKESFPDMGGFSARNLKYMRKFAEFWPDRLIVQRTVAQIPWRSNLTLLEKLKEPDLRLWYAEQTIEYGWSKNVLAEWEQQISDSLPDDLKPSLPSIEEIEKELDQKSTGDTP